MYCRRSVVDDDRSRKTRLAVDDDRRQGRWAVDDARSRIAFYQAQSKKSLDQVDRNLDRIRETLRSIRRMRLSSATIPRHSSSTISSSASRRSHQSRHSSTVVDDYPPLELPLRWRDPPPFQPPPSPNSSRPHSQSPPETITPPSDPSHPPSLSPPVRFRDSRPDEAIAFRTLDTATLINPDSASSHNQSHDLKPFQCDFDSFTTPPSRPLCLGNPMPAVFPYSSMIPHKASSHDLTQLPSLSPSDSPTCPPLPVPVSTTSSPPRSLSLPPAASSASLSSNPTPTLASPSRPTIRCIRNSAGASGSPKMFETPASTIQIAMVRFQDEFRHILVSRTIAFETDSIVGLRSLSLSRSGFGDLASDLPKPNVAKEELDLRRSTGSSGNLGGGSTASYRSVSSIREINLPDDATQDLCSIADRMIVAGYGRKCFQDWVALRNQPLQNFICRLQMRRQQGERTSGIINIDPELSETHNSSHFTRVQKSLEAFHNGENFEKQGCLSGSAPLHDAISGSHLPVNHEQAMLPVGYIILAFEEAMSVLKAKASQLGKSLQVALPSDRGLMNAQKLELDGKHQYMNASLAVAMSHTWLQKIGLQLISTKSSNICCLVSILPADILNLNVIKICALYELHHVPRRIVIFQTTMISGYTQTGVTNRALQLFEEMLQDWTEVTIASVFHVCAHFAAVDQEKWSLNYTRTLGFDLPPMVPIARLVQTHHCFDCLSKKDKSMFIWNALIIASTSHGIGLEVISVFNDIVRNRVQTNPISFSVLMYRCSHSGLVEEIKKSLKYLVDAEFKIKFMTVKANGDIGKKFSTAFKVFDPGGLIINSTPISLSTTRLDGVEPFLTQGENDAEHLN